MTPQELWAFLPFGYLFSILIETPILLLGLSPQHSWQRRLFAGVWLTACTYPIVILVLPLCIDAETHRWLYLAIAETFAPLAECALFWAAFGTRQEWGRWSMWRDFLVITLANLASFGVGELVYSQGWLNGQQARFFLVPPPNKGNLLNSDGGVPSNPDASVDGRVRLSRYGRRDRDKPMCRGSVAKGTATHWTHLGLYG